MSISCELCHAYGLGAKCLVISNNFLDEEIEKFLCECRIEIRIQCELAKPRNLLFLT